MNHHIGVCSQKWLYKKGSMTSQHREVVAKALKYCQLHGELDTQNIAKRLMDQGMNTLVIPGNVMWTYYNTYTPQRTITWSKWRCDIDGGHQLIFNIMCLLYRTPIDHIKCVNKGGMNDQYL